MNSFVLVTLVMLATVTLTAVGALILRRMVKPVVAEEHNTVLAAVFQISGTIYAVFLAFLVVTVWQAYDDARNNVALEASALTTLYRASAGMETTPGDALRQLIRTYTHAVIKEEWPIQAATDGISPTARTAAVRMYRLFQRMPPEVHARNTAIDDAVLSLLAQIMAERNKRTLQAGTSLPALMWGAATGIGLIVVSMSCFLRFERRWLHVMSVSGMTATIVLLVCIIFVMSRPFVGPMALGPEPFQHSFEVYDAVDATP